ncbi:acetate--CoA ligase family protein [Bradyrhizobium sp. SYSU BS000235]|uniref:acetate--CoA ligase family protein n=1 Tax=Bradyrhizobium sp. SYSU BS000235 TaxID=3411332 RepID=UPI003C70FA33
MGVQSLLKPKSIAIVGASEKVGPGFNAVKALEFVGYDGEVHLVNPRSPELFGRRTYASLDDIPGSVDAVFVAVGAEAVVDVARQSVRKGAGAMAILSSGFGETEDGKAAQQALVDIAEANDIAVCGPNCLGLLNFVGRAALFGTSLPDHVGRGGVAAIVQSGSVGIALLNSARGIGFSYLITTGNEAVTAAADYIDAVIDDPNVTTILVFAEQIKKPAAFMSALRRARDVGKPVIVLKSGRSQSGKAAVMAHTGAIAGSDEACDAALLAAGAMQVHSIDELIETALLASSIRVRPIGAQIGGLSLSGGEIALVLDAAEELGVEFAPLGSSQPKVKELLPPFAHLSNPLDLTWAGLYDPAVARDCAHAIASQSDVGMLVLIQDAPSRLGVQQATRYSKLLEAVANGAAAANTPVVALSNVSDQPHSALQEVADKVGIPYLRGTRVALSAISHYLKWSAHSKPNLAADSASAARLAKSGLDMVPSHRLAAEHEARDVLKSYGVEGPRETFATSVNDAVVAAEEIGFPIVLKGLVENMVHKSDAGLVKVGLTSADAVRSAAEAMLVSAAKVEGKFLGFLVQRKVSSLGEIFVGARVDADFGPLIVVGAGGVQVELYKDVAIRLAPIDEDAAREAIASTKVAQLLGGFRGAPAGDIQAVARTVSALSRFMADFSDRIHEIEINPLAVLENGKGCLALDCVLIPKGHAH